MEGSRTFIEWLSFIRKPSETELILKEWKRMRPCKGGCGTWVDGCTVNGTCTPCFSAELRRKTIIKWI